MFQAGILALLRQVSRSYTSTPLPEWETFTRSTRMLSLEPRQELPCSSNEVFIVVRGLLKMIDNLGPGGHGRVEEFFDGVSVVAPSLRPHWADRSGAPLTMSRWRSRHWSMRPMSIVAIERVTLLRMDYRVIEMLSAKHAAWGQVHSAFLWSYIDGLFAAADESKEKDAEVRYRKLMARSRSFSRRVSQRDVASYLNVTEAALSRIAKRVRDSTPEPETGTSDS